MSSNRISLRKALSTRFKSLDFTTDSTKSINIEAFRSLLMLDKWIDFLLQHPKETITAAMAYTPLTAVYAKYKQNEFTKNDVVIAVLLAIGNFDLVGYVALRKRKEYVDYLNAYGKILRSLESNSYNFSAMQMVGIVLSAKLLSDIRVLRPSLLEIIQTDDEGKLIAYLYTVSEFYMRAYYSYYHFMQSYIEKNADFEIDISPKLKALEFLQRLEPDVFQHFEKRIDELKAAFTESTEVWEILENYYRLVTSASKYAKYDELQDYIKRELITIAFLLTEHFASEFLRLDFKWEDIVYDLVNGKNITIRELLNRLDINHNETEIDRVNRILTDVGAPKLNPEEILGELSKEVNALEDDE